MRPSPSALTSSSPRDEQRARDYPRAVYALLLAATALGLVVQLYAGWSDNNWLFPFTGYSMFSSVGSDDVRVLPVLEGATQSRDDVTLEAEDFGLTDIQFRAHLRRSTGYVGTPNPGAADALGAIAEVWSAQGRDALSELRLVIETRSLTGHEIETREEFARWTEDS